MYFLEKNDIQKIGKSLGLAGDFLVDWGTNQIMDILCPEPQMETMEVKVYASVDSTNGRVWSFGNKEQMEIAVSPDSTNLIKIVELTGTYEKPVKPKVKRREQLTLSAIEEDNIRYRYSIPGSSSFKIYAEWEE